jgi:hypothetical protein
MFLGFSGRIGHNSFNIIKKRINKMNYRKSVRHCVAGFLLLVCLATPAHAISIATVGSVDKFLDSARLSNSGNGQASWVSGVLGFAATISFNNDPVASSAWELVNGSADHWAYSLATDPAHYVLKLGVGNSGADTHYLYKNLAELSWAVIDLSEMLLGQQVDFNFGRVSHIDEIDGSVQLSEPGSFGLLILGFGLLFWLMAGRFRA